MDYNLFYRCNYVDKEYLVIVGFFRKNLIIWGNVLWEIKCSKIIYGFCCWNCENWFLIVDVWYIVKDFNFINY